MARTYAQQSPLLNEGGLLRISLLTCSPSEEIYALYGHTALRITDVTRGIDEVYNYGLFDFNSPNFGWRFALGHTDYYLGKQPYEYFERAYLERGSYITEQVINLTYREAQRLLQSLEDTLNSTNRVYRYNYFYKNCSSMARDAIVRAIEGKIYYKISDLDFKTSFRAIVHEYTAHTPWTKFSQDLLLGYGADTTIALSEQQFVPQNLLKSLNYAQIEDSTGAIRPLIVQTNTIGEVRAINFSSHTLLPWHVSTLLLVITGAMFILEKRLQRQLWIWDVILLLLQGIPGILVAFMVLCSEHPSVNINWIILVMNPLPLLYLPRYIYLRKHQQADPYNVVAIVVYTAFLVSFCLEWQWISSAMGLWAFNLLLLHFIRYYQQYHSTRILTA
ncbi:MAG: DUF4105 domain-containing protein [Bacteroidales bacterium]|nr:DUF4105 domain-containing protein [Bacteroidales bacterium]